MKKKDIINLINAKAIIKKNKNLLKPIMVDGSYLLEEEWVPNIDRYKDQLNILKKEISDTLKETKQAEEVVRDIKCTHDVRIKHSRGYGAQYECVICGEIINSDNVFNWFQSVYRNRYTVSFNSKYVEDDDGDYLDPSGKTNEEVMDMILRTLEKYDDDDEVDLVKEFAKFGGYGVEVNLAQRKEENYILIIGGTNLTYLVPNERIFVKKEYQSSTIDFLNYFSQLLNVKIAVIENPDTIKGEEYTPHFKNNYLEILKYNTLYDLKNNLDYLGTVPFKIIIDLSDLCDYQYDGKSFSSKSYDLNLKEMFPHSKIIKVPKLSSISLQKLREFLLSQDTLTYANINKDYYYLNENEVNKTDLEETCQNIKTLLRKNG